MGLLSFFEIPLQSRFLLQELVFISLKMDGVESGRSGWLRQGEWLALRTTARCEPVDPLCCFIKPGDDRRQDHEEDEFLDGLLPSSSTSSDASTIASTSRELAQHGLRGDRIGEADHPGPKMEYECDCRAAWLNALTKRTNLADDALLCIEPVFSLVAGGTADAGGKANGFLRIASVWILVSRAIVGTQLDARGDSSNPLPIGHQVRHGGGTFLFYTGSRFGGLQS